MGERMFLNRNPDVGGLLSMVAAREPAVPAHRYRDNEGIRSVGHLKSIADVALSSRIPRYTAMILRIQACCSWEALLGSAGPIPSDSLSERPAKGPHLDKWIGMLLGAAVASISACGDECSAHSIAECAESKDCVVARGQPLKDDCLGNTEDVVCDKSQGLCSPALTYARDQEGRVWRFPDTCIPTDFVKVLSSVHEECSE